MKRFYFRLEKLLTIRRHREEEAEIELGIKVSRCIRLQNEIDETNAERDKVFFSDSSVSVEYELLKGAYVNRMELKSAGLHKQLKGAEKEKEKAREEFLIVSRDRKVLDKLKERKKEEYYYHQKMEEIKMIDDTVTANIGRER